MLNRNFFKISVNREPLPPQELVSGSCSDALRHAATALNKAAASLALLEERLTEVELKLKKYSDVQQPAKTERQDLTPFISYDTGSHVSTSIAASWLNRTPQTLRKWACYENGPLQPIRVNGRLAWSTADIRRILDSQPA